MITPFDTQSWGAPCCLLL
uniref:Uncharacterized protein n=1 Tax=Arundo donax TaxID=35708 RepID=A0A0A8ZP37_ARUDO